MKDLALAPDAQSKLSELRREIENGDAEIKQLVNRTSEMASAAVAEARLQGLRLIKAKALVPHGFWEFWLQNNLPGIAVRTAQKYMLLATRATGELDGADSLRAAQALLGIDGEHERGARQQPLPPELTALFHLERTVKYISAHDPTTWPTETVSEAKRVLEPVARQLWPERFA